MSHIRHWTSNIRQQTWEIRCQRTNIKPLISDVWYQTTNRHLTPDIRQQTAKVWYQRSNIREKTLDIKHLTSDNKHQTWDNKHQTSDIRCMTLVVRQETSDFWRPWSFHYWKSLKGIPVQRLSSGTTQYTLGTSTNLRSSKGIPVWGLSSSTTQ